MISEQRVDVSASMLAGASRAASRGLGVASVFLHARCRHGTGLERSASRSLRHRLWDCAQVLSASSITSISSGSSSSASCESSVWSHGRGAQMRSFASLSVIDMGFP